MDTLILWLIGLVLVLIFFLPYWIKTRREEKKALALYEEKADQLEELIPDTLHPVIDPDICIGVGNCVKVCPEKEVIALIHGRGVVVQPNRCVGHGLCERSCPVEAIQLVIGSAKRGVDIPRIKENFETNVPGIYIIGELGGMGLIKNCFEQARQCIDGIRHEKRPVPAGALDVFIVGCGPAGFAASIFAKHAGLRFITIDREADIGGTVRHYPRHKVVMTAPVEVPGYGKLNFREITKEELIELWKDLVARTTVRDALHFNETFQDAKKLDDGTFEVITNRGTYRTARIILAIGRRGTPRKLGIPGEEGPNVFYSLLEPERFQHSRIVVVGGGDAAVEAALALAEQPGNEVRLSYRRAKFVRLKPANMRRIEEAIMSGRITFLPETNLVEIHPDHVVYRDAQGQLHTLPNDYVFIFIGGTLPTDMLKKLGIAIDTKFGEPLVLRQKT